MKRLKLTLVAATLCAALYGGYIAYDYATMTDQEKMILANVEALTQIEIEEIEIVCDANEGRCHIEVDREIVFGIIPFPMYRIICDFSGSQNDFCMEVVVPN